jgi:hypothetical protein
VECARLRAVTLIDKDVDITFSFEVRRQTAFDFLKKTRNVTLYFVFFARKLVDERADESGFSGIDLSDDSLCGEQKWK